MKNRDERIAKVIANLSEYLKEPVGDGYQWPVVSDDEMSDLDDLLSEIIDLKFLPDCDRDQAINFVLYSRKDGAMVTQVVPHSPDSRSEFNSNEEEASAWEKFFDGSLKAAKYLIAEGQEALRVAMALRDLRKG